MRLLKNCLFIFLIVSVFGFSTVEPKGVGNIQHGQVYTEQDDFSELKDKYSELEKEVMKSCASTDTLVKKYAKK